jgi:predicted nucleotidyltransferase
LVAKKKTSVKKKSILETDYDIAYDFSMKAYKQFKEVIKSIVLFGSVAEGKVKKGSDIDLVIIIDDCTIDWDQELIAWYREELGKLVAAQSYKKELHINTVTLSAFWEEVKIGDPIAINVIRYGQPLVDFGGYFAPLKILLAKGKIRPTPEAIYTTLRRSPLHISRAKFNIVSSIENLYWAMVDSAHAALMAMGQVPPSPEHVGDLLNVIFVSKKKLNKKYISWFEEMHVLAHDVIHGNVKHLKGEIIDKYMDRTIEFEKVMRGITSRLLEREKIIRTERK